MVIKYPYKDQKIHPSVPFIRRNNLFFNILKVLYRDDIVVEVKIVDLIDTKDKNRKEISNECYEIVKNNI